jgi:hypothetical protein
VRIVSRCYEQGEEELTLKARGGKHLADANSDEAGDVVAVLVVVLKRDDLLVLGILGHTGTHPLGDVHNHLLIPASTSGPGRPEVRSKNEKRKERKELTQA